MGPVTTFSHTLLRMGVWNLAGNSAFFGGSSLEPDSRRAWHQVLGLCYLDADFLILVEVTPESHLGWLAEKLAEKGLDYETTLLPQPGSHLHIGFLHRAGLSVENARFVPGSEGYYTGGRRAVAVDVRAGDRFKAVVVGTHLKSGRDTADQALRDSQCQVIGNWLTDIHATPGYMRHMLILGGDFNMIPGQDVSNFHHLGGDDVMDFASSWDLQDRYSHILSSGRANLLDGFAISRRFSTRYIRGSLRLFPMHWTLNMGRDKFRREVSDHLPFVASFRVF
jgi:hypothetical protein